MWYARHCTAGVIKVDFIGIESAEKASAENIVSGLSEIVSANLQLEWPSFIEKTVAISCDGALWWAVGMALGRYLEEISHHL